MRLPDDHWVWRLNSQERSAEVKKALEFYKKFGDELEAIRLIVEEIKAALTSGIIVNNNKPADDNRLFDALDKFLDF